MKYSFSLQNEKGYTLLFAVLVSSLVLAIGISILTTSRKEYLIATSARDSASAFYAADAGLECAIVNDSQGVFSTTENKTDNFSCLVERSTVEAVPEEAPTTFTFHARFGGPSTACAVVTLTKTPTEDGTKTVIQSFGYNTGWDSSSLTCTLGSAKRVERALRYTTQ